VPVFAGQLQQSPATATNSGKTEEQTGCTKPSGEPQRRAASAYSSAAAQASESSQAEGAQASGIVSPQGARRSGSSRVGSMRSTEPGTAKGRSNRVNRTTANLKVISELAIY